MSHMIFSVLSVYALIFWGSVVQGLLIIVLSAIVHEKQLKENYQSLVNQIHREQMKFYDQ